MGAREIGWRPVGPTNTCQSVIDFAINFPRPADVVGDEKVEIVIVVKVEKRGAGTPRVVCAGNSGIRRSVLKMRPANVAQ